MPLPMVPDGPIVERALTPTRGFKDFLDALRALLRGAPQTCFIQWGTGAPETVVTAPVGSVWIRTDGGASTTFYIKEANSDATGWRAV